MFRFMLLLCLLMGVSGSSLAQKAIYDPVYYGKLTSHRGLKGLGVVRPQGRPVSREQWTDMERLWMARSVVGEASFLALEEHVEIAWVYATIARQKGLSLLRVIKGYSAAVKQRSTKTRKWILELKLNGSKPRHWPSNLSWKVHKKLWFRILDNLEEWAKGNRPSKLDGANHFGGDMDTPGIRWVKLDAPYANSFYRAEAK